MAVPVYKTYRFSNKDPVIDEVRTLFKDEGFYSPAGYKEVEARGAAKAATYKGWFSGGTRRPQNATIEATARALGYQRKFVKMK